MSTRKNKGIDRIKELIADYKNLSTDTNLNASVIAPEYFERLQRVFPNEEVYKLWLVITQDVNFSPIDKKPIQFNEDFETKSKSELKRLQQKETIFRYKFINGILRETYRADRAKAKGFRAGLDRILTHKILG